MKSSSSKRTSFVHIYYRLIAAAYPALDATSPIAGSAHSW